jgi:hypothetical protein
MLRKPSDVSDDSLLESALPADDQPDGELRLEVCPWHPVGAHLLSLNVADYKECHSRCMWCSLWLETQYARHQA